MRLLMLAMMIGGLAAALVGCGGGSMEAAEPGAYGDEPGDSAAPAGGFALEASSWTFLSRTITYDPCGAEKYIANGEPGTSIAVEPLGGARFDIHGREGRVDECTLDAWTFGCSPTEASDTTAEDWGLDALVVYDSTLSGGWWEDGGMGMSATATLRCEGADCGLIELVIGGESCQVDAELTLARE